MARAQSRCVTVNDPPLIWHEFIDHENASVLSLRAWLDSLPDAVRESHEGAIEALNELAAAGELSEFDSQIFEPVSSFPELFELKWRFKRSKGGWMRVRQYHSEPESVPQHLVALHRHRKADGADWKAQQNIEISQAQLRHVAGEARSWDIP